MAHELDFDANGEARMFSVGEKPWHWNETRGRILAAAPTTSADAIKLAGADWEVIPTDIFYQNTEGAFVPFAGRKALVRSEDFKPLSIVSDRYRPLQNREAFEWFDPFVESGLAAFETAGVLKGGRVLWVLARLTGDPMRINGDEVAKFVLLMNGHDKETGVMAQLTPIRVVCDNTLQMSMSRALQYRTCHKGNMVQKLDDLRIAMGLVHQEFGHVEEIFKHMLQTYMSIDTYEGYLDRVLPYPTPPPIPSKKADAFFQRSMDLTTQRRNRVTSLFEGQAKGFDMPGIRGTLWGAYNAVVEYADYSMGRDRANTKNRLADYMLSGPGLKFKETAWYAAMEILEMS